MTSNLTFFENIKLYVGFTEASSAALRELHPVAAPFFVPIVDDFYAAIEAHPGAQPGDHRRNGPDRTAEADAHPLDGQDAARPPRRGLLRAARADRPDARPHRAAASVHVHGDGPDPGPPARRPAHQLAGDPDKVERIATALNQIMDLELAIMLETYREDLETKHRNAERLATIGQFAASIGHELRNPLGVVESSLYLVRQHLGEHVAAQPQVGKHLDRIGSEVQRANRTINDLLDLARNRPPRRHRTGLRALVESAAEAALLPAAVTLELAIPADLTANIDPDQVRQILVNLMTNAAQALRGRGHIWVDGEATPTAASGLRVRDDGPGIPPQDRHRVFEALYTTKAKGSGLGLALCRRIMEAHEGTIELEATADRRELPALLSVAQGRRHRRAGGAPA